MSTRATPRLAAILLGIGSVALGAEHHPHWSYTGAGGPSHWSALEHDYEGCGTGKHQSPIDIKDEVVHRADLPAIEISYQPSALKVIDNGHTIQVNYAPGSFIAVGERRFQLVQFHFHKPSEEQVNDHSYEMVAHLVHKDADGKLAVIAVLLTTGSANPLVATLWNHLPKKKEQETSVDAVKIDVRELLPENRAYYTFTGSLTTPPCSEDVTWFVLRTPMSLSAAQIKRFGTIYPMNARPVQPLNDREIQASR